MYCSLQLFDTCGKCVLSLVRVICGVAFVILYVRSVNLIDAEILNRPECSSVGRAVDCSGICILSFSIHFGNQLVTGSIPVTRITFSLYIATFLVPFVHSSYTHIPQIQVLTYFRFLYAFYIFFVRLDFGYHPYHNI